MFDLTDKVVVVTGGGRGIGRGITRCMAAAGADVVLAGRSLGSLEEAAEEARSLGVRARTVVTDITRREELDHLVAAALELRGHVDCWVNNAGSASSDEVGPLLELSEAQWDSVMDLNLKWTFFAAQSAARAMVGVGGSIVNISSRSGSQPCPMTGQYGAAKAGVESLTATMSVEWGHLGIRVNAVAPGLVPTEESLAPGGMMGRPSRVARQIESVPLRRLGLVEDVGAACVYFASDEASWVTGQTLQVTGGSRITVGYLSYMHHVTEQLKAAAVDEP
jgi:3-oxoacyl-[acyl-carrier protein] reductase